MCGQCVVLHQELCSFVGGRRFAVFEYAFSSSGHVLRYPGWLGFPATSNAEQKPWTSGYVQLVLCTLDGF